MNNGNKNLAPTLNPDDKATAGFGILQSIRVSVIATIVLAVVVSGIYPAIVWGLGQLMFHNQANGSLIGKDGKPVANEKDAVGSSLIGQLFTDVKYFHARPSSAGSNGYDSTASSGSNLGPTSAKLMFGATNNVAITVIANDKAHPTTMPTSGRLEAIVAAVTGTTITVGSGATKATYTLDPSIADPAAAINLHGRSIHATTLTPGANVELRFSGNTPPTVTAINVVDTTIQDTPTAMDTTANTITFPPASSPVVVQIPSSTVFIVNGKTDAKFTDITTDMNLRILVSLQVGFDGVADRVIQYCSANNIDYTSSIPTSAYTDAEGIDDANLITAFNTANVPDKPPTITPKQAIPADAVTASGSGLDPHISIENANIQAGRVIKARNVSVEKLNELIAQSTDSPQLGFLGDAGVNVLRLNLALDQAAPAPAPVATPATAPTTAPQTATK